MTCHFSGTTVTVDSERKGDHVSVLYITTLIIINPKCTYPHDLRQKRQN